MKNDILVDSIEDALATITEIFDNVFSFIWNIPKNIMNYWAIRHISKVQEKRRRQEAKDKALYIKNNVRSYIRMSMVDFNKKNNCSSMYMDSSGRFRRVRAK